MQQPEDPAARRQIRFVRTFGAAILIATGLVWVAQGIGLPPETPLSGDPLWIVAGLVAIVAGAFVAWLVFGPSNSRD